MDTKHDESAEKNKQFEFPAPPGFMPPSNAGNEPFEQVCTLQAKPDGKTLCILKVAGKDTGYKDEGYKQETKPSYTQMGMAKDMMNTDVAGAGGGASGGY